jgi:hypothetical protein
LATGARTVFLTEGGPLHNDEHEHLDRCNIGFAWAAEENNRNGRRILGLTELMPPMAMGKWQKGRAAQLMTDWFGEMPDFLITIDVRSRELRRRQLLRAGRARALPLRPGEGRLRPAQVSPRYRRPHLGRPWP